jgi:hypothetical protein
LIDENFAPAKVHVLHPDVDQLAYTNRREEEKLEHYLVLDLSAFLDCPKESLQIGLTQELGEFPMALWSGQTELPPGLPADVQEVVVIEAFPARHQHESRYNFGFRIALCGYEIIAVFGGVEHRIRASSERLFRASALMRNRGKPFDREFVGSHCITVHHFRQLSQRITVHHFLFTFADHPPIFPL